MAVLGKPDSFECTYFLSDGSKGNWPAIQFNQVLTPAWSGGGAEGVDCQL